MAEGSGLTPLSMGLIRLFMAGVILLAFAAFRGYRIRLTTREFILLAIPGVLMWVVNNGLLMWAEQRANSGFAALVVSITPILVAFMNSLILKRTPSKLLVGSLLFSLCGLVVLMAPSLLNGTSTDFIAGLALIFCALSWAGGTVFQTYNPVELPVTVSAGYQHLIASGVFAILMLAFREPIPHPTGNAWLALIYLTVFGSVVAFTAFVNALKLLPINIAMTYAYVNPVLALFLGWWLLNEQITGWTLVGAIMVIVGVIGVFRDRPQTSEK
jgi:drug/metabolite transporter (DMT)-like permease